MARDASVLPGLRRSRFTRLKAAMAGRIGWLWQPLLYAGLIMGFLMGRALPGTPVAPLGLAFLAAVRGSGYGPVPGLPIAVSVLVGYVSVSGFDLTNILWLAFGLLLCQALATLLPIGKKGPSPLMAAMLASTSAAVPAAMVYGMSEWMAMLFWTFMAGVVALVFTLGVVDVASGRLFHMGSTETPVPIIVVVASALGGLRGLVLFEHLSLVDLAAGVVALVCAMAGGAAFGAAAGAVLCLGLVFSSLGEGPGAAQLVTTVGLAYVMSSFLAGLFRDLGRLGVAIAYLLALSMVTILLVEDLGYVQSLLVSALAAGAVFCLMPRRWLQELPAAFVSIPYRQPAAPPEPTVQFLERLRHMTRVLKEISRTYDQVAVVEAPPEPTAAEVFSQVRDRVCRSCSLFEQCWSAEQERTQAVYQGLWDTIDAAGPLPVNGVPEQLEDFCIYPDRVAFTLNYLYDIHNDRLLWERRLDEGRAVSGEYVRNVSRIMERMAEEASLGKGGAQERTPTLRCVAGVARLPKRGGHVSGDSFVTAPISGGRFLLALSDGMGVGHGAALESRQAVKLLQELLDVGLSTDLAVRTVNSVFLLRSPQDQFATIDFGVVDMTTGRAEFVKIGAAPGFIKRGKDITLIKAATVPVGIVHDIQVEPDHRLLRPGDIVVMVTDGIWEVSDDPDDKERWLIDHLSRETSTDPEQIAESVLAQALDFMPDASDDMTVLVVRVAQAGGMSALSEGQRILTDRWAAVRRAPRLKPKGKRRKGS